jgi:L-threonylcarbamoyladenylate synthase
VTIKFENDMAACLDVIKRGGLILYPTDTIWGIGCDATNELAVKKIYALKNRAQSQSLISLVNDDAMLNKYVREVPSAAWDLIQYSEKPITIIYDDVKGIAANAIANDGTAAFRIVKDVFCQQLIYRLRRPLISTSANKSGQPTAETFSAIDDEIKNGVDYIVKYRQEEQKKNSASTIIQLKNSGEIKIIRK